MSDASGEQTLLEVGAASAALPGQLVSGDLHLVEGFPGGALVGAIDGLGHGGDAAHAALRAQSVIEEEPGAPLPTLFERCHARLSRTRGVAMSLASFAGADGSMTWLGVGNVEGSLFRADAHGSGPAESILLLGGVVGYQLPRLRPSVTQVGPGDMLVLATDGIGSGFRRTLDPTGPAQEVADRVFSEHARESDDALVVVARYRGEPA